jgi:heme exporter protein A
MMLQTTNLVKTFGLRPILRGVNLEVGPGECAALVGPNGAGKTTLVRILATLSKPSLGQASVAGYPLPGGAPQARQRLGLVAHHTLLYADLTAEENLHFYARMYGLRQPAGRISAVLEQVGLQRRRRDLVRTFSRGMQQRLAIARALLPGPAVLLLDEPYTGLDPQAAHMLDEVLRSAVADGRTVLLTTHDLPRALTLASSVMIMTRGVIAWSSPTAGLTPAAFADAYAAATA